MRLLNNNVGGDGGGGGGGINFGGASSPATEAADVCGSTVSSVICGSTVSSVSELDDLFEEIGEGTLEKAEPEEVDAITGLLKATMTMPQSNSLSDVAAR